MQSGVGSAAPTCFVAYSAAAISPFYEAYSNRGLRQSFVQVVFALSTKGPLVPALV